MTDRYRGLVVLLDDNLRSDDAQPILQLIQQIKGVRRVEPQIGNGNDQITEMKVRQDLGEKLWQVLYPEHKR